MTELEASARVALVVPSLDGRTDVLRASIDRQTRRPDELQVVVGVRPSGRARNIGAWRTTGEILLFVDDDAVFGVDDAIANLVAPLLEDATIGVTGASKLVPREAPAFQQRVAQEVPRIEHAVVADPLETNPPPLRHGYVEITTTCCAMRRSVFDEAGGFDEELERGVDTEFFYRVRRLGYRLLLVPNTWVYHPAPPTLAALVRKHFLYGTGYAQEVRIDASRAAGRYLRTPAHALAYIVIRTLALLPHAVFPYTHAAPDIRPGLKPLRAIASYAAALGYVYGWYRCPVPRRGRRREVEPQLGSSRCVRHLLVHLRRRLRHRHRG